MGLGQFFMARVGSGWVSHLWFGFEFSKISPKKKLLQVGSESTRVEAGSASYLLWVKSKLGSGQGPSLAFRPQFWRKPLGKNVNLFSVHLLFIVFNQQPRKSVVKYLNPI